MPHRLLYCIVFIEGFCSLGAEVIALRQIVPHMGSSITVTAPTIGFFLLSLALGYQAGAKVADNYLAVAGKNFLIAATLCGAGLAGVTVDAIFTALQEPLSAYLAFIAIILCPLAWLMGQTVPILSNLLKHERTGEASGYALYYSTLGSFLGSISLSLLIMQWLGVSMAVLICALLLVFGYLLLRGGHWRNLAVATASAAVIVAANIGLRPVIETAYANYEVQPVNLADSLNARSFRNNQSLASLIDDSEPRHYTRYIHRIRDILLRDFAFRDRKILVLGAGGFTLSNREPLNHYTYVDIDPAIRGIAEQRFLGEAANGTFIADDARSYVAHSPQRFDAAIVDVYSAQTSIPAHLVTREFWQSSRRVLNNDGLMIANLLLDARLATPYARNLLATIESVYGRCAVEVLHRTQALSNVIVVCHNSSPANTAQIYIDERNAADFDLARSR